MNYLSLSRTIPYSLVVKHLFFGKALHFFANIANGLLSAYFIKKTAEWLYLLFLALTSLSIT